MGSHEHGPVDGGAMVGERLRAWRSERRLSLAALAARAGVGKGSLSEIENGVRNPTLGTLYAIAGALGVPLATLLAERAGTEVSSPGILARLLDSTRHDDGVVVEVYLLRVDPGPTHTSPSHGRGVVEHLLVTHGRIRAGRRGREVEIGPGESAGWASSVIHTYRACGDEPALGVLTIRSPDPSAGRQPR